MLKRHTYVSAVDAVDASAAVEAELGAVLTRSFLTALAYNSRHSTFKTPYWTYMYGYLTGTAGHS